MSKLDISSTAIEKGIDLVKGFVEKLAGGAIEEAGLMLTERVRLRRLRNQITILEKAKKIAEETNIDVGQINLKVLVPLLEYSSLEEEETLQDMWANLIANYADSKNTFHSSVFPYILNQLSTIEAKKLDIACKQILTHSAIYGFPSLNEIELSNLERLGLIEKIPNARIVNDIIYTNNKKQGIKFGYSSRYRITGLAKEFIKACNNNI